MIHGVVRAAGQAGVAWSLAFGSIFAVPLRFLSGMPEHGGRRLLQDLGS